MSHSQPPSNNNLPENDSAMLSGAEMLVHSLHREGVEFIFGYPGGALLHVYDALFTNSAMIEHILVRHEQGATHAADGYARATGKPGVVLVTSGPGATNAITGIATAYMDSIPLIILSGQVMSHLIGTDSFQETDMTGISRPIVKHNFLIQSAKDIPQTIKKAFHIATTGRPGPVVIDITKDATAPNTLLPFNYPESVEIRAYQPSTKGHPLQIKKAIKLIKQSKKPVIYYGGGVILSEASDLLRKFAALTNIPVTSTLMGLGAYPTSAPNYLGMLGMHGTYQANLAMHHADLIIAIGARFDDRITNTPAKFAPEAKIIHVDIEPANISKIIHVDVPIVGDAKTILQQFIDKLKPDDIPAAATLAPWHSMIAQWIAENGLKHDLYKDAKSQDIILPQMAVQMINSLTDKDAVITTDVGQHQMFAAQYFAFEQPRRWITSGGLGTMGFGFPAAMGILLDDKQKQVICITGEGSIQMCLQELSTCTQYGLPVKIFNLNNQALGMVKQWQDMNYGGRHSHSTYQNSLPDFVKLVEAFGHVGMYVDKPQELEHVIKHALSLRDQLVFVDISVDPEEHVYPMLVAPNGAMNNMWLDKNTRT